MANPQSDLIGGEEDFAAMLEESFKGRGTTKGGELKENEIVRGSVVQITKDYAVVDIGYKSEGQVPIQEFGLVDGKPNVKVGDKVDVLLESRENDTGMVVLSKEKADKMRIWDEISAACERDELVEGTIVERVKGGLSVDIGVKAFLPGSQVDLRPIRNLDKLIGEKFKFKVIKFNKKRGNIVLSRRVLLEKERETLKKDTLQKLKEGAILTGIVKNLTDYGAFIDLGGIDGLLHITDMSWGRVGHPSEMFVIGDKVEVMVLKYDRESGRISLGVKQKSSDPWTSVATKYPVGSRVRGRVVSLTDYGAFIELEPGVEGLVHVSEMSWTHEVRHPSRLVSIGDQVEAAVLNVDIPNRKISLGMKQTAPNPWDMVESKYPSGTRIEGKVKSLTDFGAFIGLEEGIDGLIHISDMSWARHVKHPSGLCKKGQKIEAVVLRIDKDKERLSLGYKQLTRDPWEEEIPQRHKVGTTAPGKVTKITDFGVFVELEGGVEGLIHISETGLEPQARLEDKFKINDTVSAKIIKTDREERKIALSLREQQLDAERKQVDEFHATQGAVDQSLGRTAQKTKKRPDAESGDPDVTS